MFEPTPDPIDQGSQLAEAERKSLEAAQRRQAAPKQVKNADGTWPTTECEECGAPIGEKRLEAIGAIDCIECASHRERQGKQYAKR